MGASMLRLLRPSRTPLLITTSFRTRYFAESSTARSQSTSTSATMSVQQSVDTLITDNKVIIFSKTWCPYCKKAKALLKELTPEENLKIIELDLESNGDDIQAYLKTKYGQSSVPNIFIRKQHIGGNDSLQAKHREGAIVPLIAA